MASLNQALGNHVCKVRTARVTEEDGGTIQIAVTVEFKDGERGTKYIGNKTPKSLELMRKTLKACGFDIDKFDIAELANNPDLLDGEDVDVVVGENVYNGQTSNRIDWINKIRKAPSDAALSDLTAKLRAVKKDGEKEEGGL